jgi:riboflavin synthase
MFTGIIETTGVIRSLTHEGGNLQLAVSSSLSNELKVDQSVAHDGICLTVVGLGKGYHLVTAIEETLQRTNLGTLKVGDVMNLERCLSVNGRFDGHIVQGHVDSVGTCESVEDHNGSWVFYFRYENSNNITVEKGSIAINGVSLTVVDSKESSFSVAIIPYTFANTNFKNLKVNSLVNLEFDIVGKYLARMFAASGRKI